MISIPDAKEPTLKVAVTELPISPSPSAPSSATVPATVNMPAALPTPPTATSPQSKGTQGISQLDATSDTESEKEFSPLSLAKDYTPLPQYKDAGTTETDFGGLLTGPKLKLHEDLKDGCGGQLWPAGMVLARWLLRYHGKGEDARGGLRGARILELGAGGGLVGLAVAAGCDLGDEPEKLIMTDQIEMYSLMQHNIGLNGLGRRVEAQVLNWGEPLPPNIMANPPNVILAAECVYFEPAFPLLQKTLSDLLELCPDAVIYFCFKKRRRADMGFVKQARKKFTVTDLEDVDRPVWSRQGLHLFSFTGKKGQQRS
ncbi:putative methyltransferase-domain-containing protein [Xylariaceae sp. FL1272]|nr:putative methyltransferase-domain-containing protein [Xylariaceae sp. FL1272]